MHGPTTPADAEPNGLSGLVRDQRVTFVLVGAVNLMLFATFFVLSYQLVGSRIGYLSCQVLSYLLAILCAFALHRSFVFKVRGHVWRDLLRFTAVNLGTLGLNVVLLPLFVEVLGLPVLPAQFLVICLTVVVSYAGHRWFSFHRPARSVEASPGSPTRPDVLTQHCDPNGGPWH